MAGSSTPHNPQQIAGDKTPKAPASFALRLRRNQPGGQQSDGHSWPLQCVKKIVHHTNAICLRAISRIGKVKLRSSGSNA